MGGKVRKELLQIKPRTVNRELPEAGLTLELFKSREVNHFVMIQGCLGFPLLQRCLGTLEVPGPPVSPVRSLSGRSCTTSLLCSPRARPGPCLPHYGLLLFGAGPKKPQKKGS